MGDRYDRQQSIVRGRNGGTMKPPEVILNWGLAPAQRSLSSPAPVGHNGGPPIEQPADLFVRYAWKVAHREVWKNPPMDILRFRVARAETAGVSYETYMKALLDTGRHLQREDVSPVSGDRSADIAPMGHSQPIEGLAAKNAKTNA